MGHDHQWIYEFAKSFARYLKLIKKSNLTLLETHLTVAFTL